MTGEYSRGSRPRLCFVGPMVGRNPGFVTMQGLILSGHFAEAGYPVIAVSSQTNRYARLFDIAWTVIRRRHAIDVLIVEVYGGRSFVVEDLASWLGRLFGHRIILWLHGGALTEFMTRFPNWTRRVLSRGEVLVTPSEFLARGAAGHGFQARVIPNVIDVGAYPFRLRGPVRPRLFWMRSLHPVWNPLMAVRVLGRLRSSGADATLVLAGPDKGLEAEARLLAERMDLSNHVQFAGFLDMAGKLREGGAADIYINTNRIDNMPVAVVEACALGLPVVSTAVGGIPDLLKHEETGLLVPDDDDEAMAGAIRRLVEDPGLARRLSTNGRRLAERSAWENVRPQWEHLFGRAPEIKDHGGSVSRSRVSRAAGDSEGIGAVGAPRKG